MDKLMPLTSIARSFRTALYKMTPKEREQLPASSYRAEYNSLRKKVINAFPKLAKYVASAVNDDTNLDEEATPRYIEMLKYVEQYFQLLINTERTDTARSAVRGDDPYFTVDPYA